MPIMTYYLYHWVPKDMEGDTLYPLNALKEMHPELYDKKAEKYSWRKQVMERKVWPLDCLWNDVLHFTAVHPADVKKAMEEAGDTERYETRCYQIDPKLLDPAKTTVLLYTHEPEKQYGPSDYATFDPDGLEPYTVIPEVTKEYYRKCFAEGKNPLVYPWVPHIFYKGSLGVKDLPIVTVD
ncbi:MAG TPA: hypothetical protein VGE62_00400 [Candidatus Paceibacterota bacterium]